MLAKSRLDGARVGCAALLVGSVRGCLLFPLDNSKLAAKNSDRKTFFADEDVLRKRYWKDSGLTQAPPTLDEYLAKVVTRDIGAAKARRRSGSEIRSGVSACRWSLTTSARRKHERFTARVAPSDAAYKKLQGLHLPLYRRRVRTLGVWRSHIHAAYGAGGYFQIGGANPLLLESVLNDPKLRKTNFVMLQRRLALHARSCRSALEAECLRRFPQSRPS